MLFRFLYKRVCKILFSPLENDIHIVAPQCNIFYVLRACECLYLNAYIHFGMWTKPSSKLPANMQDISSPYVDVKFNTFELLDSYWNRKYSIEEIEVEVLRLFMQATQTIVMHIAVSAKYS